MNVLVNSWFLTARLLRHLLRQPWSMAFTLLQPIVWMLLYGQVFRRISDLPGFEGMSYITFLTPAIVIMSGLFSAGFVGLGILTDLDSGLMDRFLISPVSRPALILDRLISLAIKIVPQTILLLGIGTLLGARYAGGFRGFLVLLGAAILLATAFGGLSIALALISRKQDTVIGAMNFILLPLTFLSGAFIATNLIPGWVRGIALLNPVNWSVEAARAGFQPHTDWHFITTRFLVLAVFMLTSCWFATVSFRHYRRSA